MKKLTKLLGIVLIFALVMSMGIMAWASDVDPGESGGSSDGEGGANTPTSCSITINPGDDATGTVSTSYTYYELLKASINGDAVSYYLPSPTGDTLKGLLDAVTVNDVDLFSFTKSADGKRWIATINEKSPGVAFSDTDGEAISAALNTDAIKAAALGTASFDQSSGSAVAEGLDAGYYLITSNLGSKLVLQTLGDVVINTKNEYHTNSKIASKTNMNVGDNVTYTITIHVPATAVVGQEITIHDTLAEQLSANLNSIAAKYVTPAAEEGGEATETTVTLTDGTKKAETETFAKKFTIDANMLDKDVIITYEAELLSTAADDTGYVNQVFSNTTAYETVPVEVKVWTFDFDLDKNFTGVESGDADKYEATFVLYPSVETTSEDGTTSTSQGTTAIEFTVVSTTSGEGENQVINVTGYKKADSDDSGKTTEIKVKGGDPINVCGLKAGTYFLVETATADGFNQLTDPVVITIADTTQAGDANPSHTVSYKIGNSTETTGVVTVVNQSGTVLPSTGGIGTTIFYVVGSVLVIAAGVLLVTKKRMGRD